MSFREKIAWVAFLSTVLIWGGYFLLVARAAWGGGSLGLPFLVLFGLATLAQALVVGGVAAVAAALAPGDAHAAADERDRAVARRAGGLAYLAVLLGLAGVIVALHIGLHGRGTIFALLGLVMLGEATRFGAQALGYRRLR
jgi:hypothetical protein